MHDGALDAARPSSVRPEIFRGPTARPLTAATLRRWTRSESAGWRARALDGGDGVRVRPAFTPRRRVCPAGRQSRVNAEPRPHARREHAAFTPPSGGAAGGFMPEGAAGRGVPARCTPAGAAPIRLCRWAPSRGPAGRCGMQTACAGGRGGVARVGGVGRAVGGGSAGAPHPVRRPLSAPTARRVGPPRPVPNPPNRLNHPMPAAPSALPPPPPPCRAHARCGGGGRRGRTAMAGPQTPFTP